MKQLFFVALFSLVSAGCGYEGHYRYECQDPANWEDSDCNPPACLVDGICTETLIGFDPTETTEITETTVEEIVVP